jgi:translation initiation factor 3 subunit M
MSSTDPVSQIQELLDYTARSDLEDERNALLQSFKDIVKTEEGAKPIEEDEDRQRRAFELVLNHTKGIGEGSESEIEGFFNLLYSYLFTLWPVDSSQTRRYVIFLLEIISTSRSDNSSVKYRILTNLFNATPPSSALRLPIYTTTLQVAAANSELELLALSKSDIERWLKEWEVSDAERSQFLKMIVDTLTQAGQLESAYEYRIVYTLSVPPSSPESRSAAVDTIVAALRLPSIFDFDALYNLDAVIAVKDHELFPLLHIFLNNGFPEFRAWADGHSAVLDSYQLDISQLEHKMRLLAFSSLGFDYIGRDLPYSTIASTLQIDASEVDKWTIDVIRAGLLSGKLSQSTQNLHVYGSAARKFERGQWEALEKRLLAWKAGLASVIEVVANAQKRGGGVAEVVQAAQNEQGVQVEGTA